jgi:DNA-binding response OmpR family regulator
MSDNPRREVLIVDDDDSIRKILKLRLLQERVAVVEASSGSEAARLLSERDFRAVVLDVQLGDMNGLDLVEKIRRSGRTAPRIVVLSGEIELGASMAAEYGEEVTFLPKPFNAEQVVHVISEERGSAAAPSARRVSSPEERLQSDRVLSRSDGLRRLDLEIDLCRRYDGQLSLLRLDKALCEVVTEILADDRRGFFRKIDVVFRDDDGGGFAILPATDRQGARLFSQQLLSRARLYEDSSFSSDAHSTGDSVFGIATFKEDGDTSDELVRAACAARPMSRSIADTPHGRPEGADVLVVEDTADIATLLKLRLVKSGYRPRVAATLAEAFEELRKTIPEIVLLDLGLPDGNGQEFLTSIRENPETRNLPVVILSAIASTDQIEEGFVRGANSYLSKPYSQKDLLSCIEMLLTEARAHKEAACGS